jgi:KDO2-lipid IV(A) lauroyltransferase
MTATSQTYVPPTQGKVVQWWLRIFFLLARHMSVVLYAVRPLAVWITVLSSRQIREATAANAARIYGSPLGFVARLTFARRVTRSFYEFVVDSARCSSISVKRLRGRIQSVDGLDAYKQARAQKRGAILLTAHIGSFEVGLAALSSVEPRVHVVFKRDGFGQWERARSELRRHLGVIEAPIDDGLSMLFQLKAALEADEVVVMQGDRAWPGQQSVEVPVLHGHLRLPTGPVKLAQVNDSPIIPVLAVRSGPARFRVLLGPPIVVSEYVDVRSAVAAVGEAMGRFIGAVPQQWLVLHKAFVEDQEK